jgi:hypothetical protein
MSDQNLQKKKYTSLTNGDKEEIQEQLKNGVSISSLAQKYGVHLTTIYRLKNGFQDKPGQGIKRSGNFHEYKNLQDRKKMRLPKYDEVDKCLYYWFRQMRARDFPVNGDMLLQKAAEFNKALNGKQGWTPSNGFLRTFKSRYGIKCKALTGEIASADLEAADEYIAKYPTESEGFDPNCQYNGDEFGLDYRSLPTKSLVQDGDECQVILLKYSFTVNILRISTG